jgi:hypothetical protein
MPIGVAPAQAHGHDELNTLIGLHLPFFSPFKASLSHPGLTDKNVHTLSGWTSHIVYWAAQVRNLG